MTDKTDIKSPAVGDTWYRYEDHRYASLNEWDEVSSVSVQLQLWEFKVSKVTPKGVWLQATWSEPRFVRLEARKRYAHPSKEEALTALKARKAAQMRILQTQLGYAQRAAALADRELNTLSAQPEGRTIHQLLGT